MMSGCPPGLYSLPPMATNSFLSASTSFAAMCQCPIVTPAWLYGAGCAATVVAISMDASATTTSRCFFMARIIAPHFRAKRARTSGICRQVREAFPARPALLGGRFSVVFVADVFQQFAVRHEYERQRHGPRARVRLRIVDRDVHVHVTEVLAAKP